MGAFVSLKYVGRGLGNNYQAITPPVSSKLVHHRFVRFEKKERKKFLGGEKIRVETQVPTLLEDYCRGVESQTRGGLPRKREGGCGLEWIFWGSERIIDDRLPCQDAMKLFTEKPKPNPI